MDDAGGVQVPRFQAGECVIELGERDRLPPVLSCWADLGQVVNGMCATLAVNCRC